MKKTLKLSPNATPDVDMYQVKDDFSTLARAHEIRSDKARHARALAHGAKMAGVVDFESGKKKRK